MLERCSPRYAPGVGCARKDITRERKAPKPNWISNGIPIRWEPGNRGKTPDRAVGSLGHLGYLTKISTIDRSAWAFFACKNR